jgi:NAD(P)-dependent dehydrogenase (short-subunit alcohol dehydrogenase family)
MKKPVSLIIGANSGIAKALAKKMYDNKESLIVITRHDDYYRKEEFSNVEIIAVDNYDEIEITRSLKVINQLNDIDIVKVFICNGMLHSKNCHPEKRLEDFSLDSFNEILKVNTTTPMLWLKELILTLSFKSPCKIALLSARVGSLTDNKLGGWYSYRASKTALNMLLKTASIELARRAKKVKLISFHPGTTDTPLSKPFQKNVPNGKLFTPDFVAEQLLGVVDKTEVDGELTYVDWQGKRIDW